MPDACFSLSATHYPLSPSDNPLSLSLLSDQCQQSLERICEFGQAFFHQDFFQLREVDLLVDVVQDGGGGQLIDLAREDLAGHLLDGGIRGRRICLYVRTGQSVDIFVGRIGRILGPGAGEDEFLSQWQLLVSPELLILFPQTLGIDDPDQTLCGRRQVGNVLLRVHVDSTDEDAVDGFESDQ